MSPPLDRVAWLRELRAAVARAGGDDSACAYYLPPELAGWAVETLGALLGLVTPGRAIIGPGGVLGHLDGFPVIVSEEVSPGTIRFGPPIRYL